MSAFTGPLTVTFSDFGRVARLAEPLVWELDEEGSGRKVVVPKGFWTDGASIPRVLWPIMPAWGSYETRAAILHDYLLFRLACNHTRPGLETRADADRQFYLALIALGTGQERAAAIWAAVRLYGIAKNSWLRISSRLL